MTFSLAALFSAVWFGVIFAESGLWALLLVRRAYREYPAFVTFMSFCVARSWLLLYVGYQHPGGYQTIRWLAYMPQMVILVAVVLEVVRHLFHPLESLPKGTITHFVAAISLIGLLATGFAIRHPGAQASAWMTFATAMDQALTWILCAMFILIALFATYFGVQWRHRLYGVGLGFLLYLCTDVVVTTALTQLRLLPRSPIRLLDMLAFLVACLIWIYYFWRPGQARTAPTYREVEELRALVGAFSRRVQHVRIRTDERPANRPVGDQRGGATYVG